MQLEDMPTIVLTGAVAGLGWFIKELWEGHKKLRNDMTELGVKLPVSFASKEDMRDSRDEIRKVEDRLNDRINRSETQILGRLDKLSDMVQKSLSDIISHFDKSPK